MKCCDGSIYFKKYAMLINKTLNIFAIYPHTLYKYFIY